MDIAEKGVVGKFKRLLEGKDRKLGFLNAKKFRDALNEGHCGNSVGIDVAPPTPVPMPPLHNRNLGKNELSGHTDWYRRDYKRMLRVIEDCLDKLYTNLEPEGLKKENSIIKRMLDGLAELRKSIASNKMFNEEKAGEFIGELNEFLVSSEDEEIQELVESLQEITDPDKEAMKDAKKDKEMMEDGKKDENFFAQQQARKIGNKAVKKKKNEDEVSDLQDKEDERMKKMKQMNKDSKKDKEQAQDKIDRAKERRDREKERERKQDELDENERQLQGKKMPDKGKNIDAKRNQKSIDMDSSDAESGTFANQLADKNNDKKFADDITQKKYSRNHSSKIKQEEDENEVDKRRAKDQEDENEKNEYYDKVIEKSMDAITKDVQISKGPEPPTKKAPKRRADQEKGETKPEVLKMAETISKHVHRGMYHG